MNLKKQLHIDRVSKTRYIRVQEFADIIQILDILKNLSSLSIFL